MYADVLKYGALGIGLVALIYAAGLVKVELQRPEVRPDARRLILYYMTGAIFRAYPVVAHSRYRWTLKSLWAGTATPDLVGVGANRIGTLYSSSVLA
jgi:hypothetical protein